VKFEPKDFPTFSVTKPAIWAAKMANIALKSSLLEARADLELEWKAEPNKNRNHIASRIGGEIDFINGWLEELEE